MSEPITEALRKSLRLMYIGTTNIRKNPYDNKVTAIIFSAIL